MINRTGVTAPTPGMPPILPTVDSCGSIPPLTGIAWITRAFLSTTVTWPLKRMFISRITVVYRMVVEPTAMTKVAAIATPRMHRAVLIFLRRRFLKQNVASLVVISPWVTLRENYINVGNLVIMV